MADMVRSTVTNLYYDPREMVKIVNTKQAMLYLKNHCTLYDLWESKGTLVFLFSRSETTALYEKWLNRELV